MHKRKAEQMKKENRKNIMAPSVMLSAFLLWTAAVRYFDVKPIGPEGSYVGLASLNGFVHGITGVHMRLYTLTDLLGLVPIAFAAAFALVGLIQWIRRGHLLKVDRDILALGGFYIAVMTVYVLFEVFPVNYRPVLIGGILEPSYPSSTTLLVMCVIPTGMMQLDRRIKNSFFKRCIRLYITAFTLFMVIGRLISGVHWFTDIIGGILLSAGLVLMYRFIACLINAE